MDSGLDEDTSVAGDGTEPVYTNADSVLKRMSSSLNITTQTGTEEDDSLSIIYAKDRKAFESFPFHEAVWRPIEALWGKPAFAAPRIPRVDKFYRMPANHKDHMFKKPKVDTIMAIPATGTSYRSGLDWGDKKVDTFLKRSYSISTTTKCMLQNTSTRCGTSCLLPYRLLP